MVQISYQVDGVDQLHRNLSLLIDNLDNLSDFFSESVDLIEKRTDELFKSEWKAVQKGNQWDELAPSTVKARERRWGYYKNQPWSNPWILQRTWNLRDSRTKKINNIEASLTMDAYYAIFHHRGGPKLPERSIIDLDNDTNAELVRILQNHIWKNVWIYWKQI